MWLKDSTCITLEGNSGADGMLYANRIPLSNYYELRKNYAQVPVCTERLVGKKGVNHLKVQVANRFDFVDLSEKVSFEWRLLDGKHVVSEGKRVSNVWLVVWAIYRLNWYWMNLLQIDFMFWK